MNSIRLPGIYSSGRPENLLESCMTSILHVAMCGLPSDMRKYQRSSIPLSIPESTMEVHNNYTFLQWAFCQDDWDLKNVFCATEEMCKPSHKLTFHLGSWVNKCRVLFWGRDIHNVQAADRSRIHNNRKLIFPAIDHRDFVARMYSVVRRLRELNWILYPVLRNPTSKTA